MEETQQLRQKKIITLIGRLETPIILRKPFYKKHGCWIKVVRDRKNDKRPLVTSISKIVKGLPQIPTILNGYRGYVKVTCVGFSLQNLKQKISIFLQKRFLGNLSSEGYGRIVWEECLIDTFQSSSFIHNKKLKIRKGLGINYPQELQRLLIALMLHDFVDNDYHPSKIYHSITIEDEEIRDACVNHHNGEKSTNALVPLIKYYDALASRFFRKKIVHVHQRYRKGKEKIDFQQLIREIEQKQHSAYKLYNFIYSSKELGRIVESLQYGENDLRHHLLAMVNLAINDYYWKNLKITKGKISLSASKREELTTAMDAEMHSLLTMSIADPENSTNSMNGKARNIGRENQLREN